MSAKASGAPVLLTSIPVLEPAFGSADRSDDAARARRGHLPSTLQRGQKAEEAIAIARAETARYREELDARRDRESPSALRYGGGSVTRIVASTVSKAPLRSAGWS